MLTLLYYMYLRNITLPLATQLCYQTEPRKSNTCTELQMHTSATLISLSQMISRMLIVKGGSQLLLYLLQGGGGVAMPTDANPLPSRYVID